MRSIPQDGEAIGSEINVPLIQQTWSLFYQVEVTGLFEGKQDQHTCTNLRSIKPLSEDLSTAPVSGWHHLHD